MKIRANVLTTMLILLAACASPCGGSSTTSLKKLTPNFSTAWPKHIIQAGDSTGSYRGADGVDLGDVNHDGLMDVVSAWEEGGSVTVSLHPPSGSDPTVPWATTTATGMAGVEDAKFVDLDNDGSLDVVACSDGGQRIYVDFANSSGTYTVITLSASLNHGHWMQSSGADVDGDGDLDIIAGSRAGTVTNPAVIAWFENPGAGNQRDGTLWVYHQITLAGWAMTVQARDIDGDGDFDVFVTDRDSYKTPDNVTHWDLYGARWIEHTTSGWTNHAMEQAGSCTNCTPGDEMYGMLYDWDGDGTLDVLNGTSSSGHTNRVVIHHNNGWTTAAPWPNQFITSAAVNTNVGHYQGLDVGDFDGDGLKDLAISTWETNTCCGSTQSGVFWVRNLGNGDWEFEEVSGPNGSKYDNVIAWDVDGDGDLDLIDSEQLDDQSRTVHTGGEGVEWFENTLIDHSVDGSMQDAYIPADSSIDALIDAAVDSPCP